MIFLWLIYSGTAIPSSLLFSVFSLSQLIFLFCQSFFFVCSIHMQFVLNNFKFSSFTLDAGESHLYNYETYIADCFHTKQKTFQPKNSHKMVLSLTIFVSLLEYTFFLALKYRIIAVSTWCLPLNTQNLLEDAVGLVHRIESKIVLKVQA